MFANDKPSPVFTVRGYGRASTDQQVVSTEQQAAVAFDAFNLFKRCHQEWANAVWGGFFADEATCRLTTFRERHQGSLILASSQRGDAIICSTADRIFGSLTDLCDTLDFVHKAGIQLRVLDRNIDTTDDIGQGVFKILAVVAEMEVKRTRKRTRDAIEYRKRIGRPAGPTPIGWQTKLVRIPGVPTAQRYLVPDNAARRLAREMLQIYRQFGKGYRKTHRYVNNILRITQRNGRRWSEMSFTNWCKAAEYDFPLPNGTHVPAPIPADAMPVKISTISEDD